jgi:dimeric dUTPase (all-alpha-NTP-PPase superfamily)
MHRKIELMLEMQDSMNTKVHSQWFEQDFEWYRAIWIECAEMLDHYGWKWWKHQTPDKDQVMLELVDIFHFGLSCRIDGKQSFAAIAQQLADEMENSNTESDFRLTLEKVAEYALRHHGFAADYFAGCMNQIEMNFDDLFRQYVGKNTLNFFRQDHGYKNGSYIKVWNGKEDNEVLVELINRLDIDADDFKEQVYAGLVAAYPSK